MTIYSDRRFDDLLTDGCEISLNCFLLNKFSSFLLMSSPGKAGTQARVGHDSVPCSGDISLIGGHRFEVGKPDDDMLLTKTVFLTVLDGLDADVEVEASEAFTPYEATLEGKGKPPA